MPLMWSELSQIVCKYHSFRVASQTPMPYLHCHAAKLACVKLKFGSVVRLILTKE